MFRSSLMISAPPARLSAAAVFVLTITLAAAPLHAAVKHTAKKPVASKSSSGKKSTHTAKPAGRSAHGKGPKNSARSTKASHKLTPAERKAQAAALERSARLHSAFVATTQLRPMAQQLASTRSAASYAGVLSYAHAHPGVQASAAYLALGHAYYLDHRYSDSIDSYRLVQAGADLSDYADYLGAQALIAANRPADVFPLLDNFAVRHPDSIFTVSAPLLLASAYTQQKNGSAAVRVLEPMLSTPEAEHADYRLALARAYQAAGDTTHAIALYRNLFIQQPLTYEAGQAYPQLLALGAPPTAAERKLRADQLFNAKRYGEALAEYDAIKHDSSLSQADRDGLEIYSAVCMLKQKHLSRHDVDKLPVTSDDTAALKQYLYAEISRNEKDRVTHDQIIAQMLAKYPQSRWFEEALYSGGNMYLLTHDIPQAIYHYNLLVEHFPNSIYAPSAHWRDAWMNYRLRHYAEAARLMEEQVTRYPASVEASSALYWRGRIYEDEDHNFSQAAQYYRSLNANYTNFYYGVLARGRLAVLGSVAEVAPAPALASVRKLTVPDLAAAVPEDDPHYVKARLLANAALNEYIAPEIAASPDSGEWGALAQAHIYASYGEITRALQSMKHSGISFFALPTDQVPLTYWRLLFPQPYWSSLVENSHTNGLDPFLVASLIRQESEFNAGAVSPARACGLMQLLPSVGKEQAKKLGIRHFQAADLFNPNTNLQLGTRNLRQVLDRFGGQAEYALAAYNAGDVPVRQWMAAGEYKDIPEFVESIPYTETREYVQAIMRNREMYRMVETRTQR